MLMLVLVFPHLVCAEPADDYSWLDSLSEEQLRELDVEIHKRIPYEPAVSSGIGDPVPSGEKNMSEDPDIGREMSEAILQKLVFICECELDYLEELDWTYSTFQKNQVTKATIYPAWYTMYFVVGDTESQRTHGTPLRRFIVYFNEYGADFKASLDADDGGKTLIRDVQSSLFVPMLEKHGGDILATVLSISSLMNRYLHLPDHLSSVLKDMEELKNTYPDNIYSQDLEALYAAASALVSFGEPSGSNAALVTKARALADMLPGYRSLVDDLRERFTALGLAWESSSDLAYEHEISDEVQEMIDRGTVPKLGSDTLPADKKEIKAGDLVVYGSYPQTASGNDNTPIEWIVLDVQEGRALLLSRYGLDRQLYNKKKAKVTWEKCSLRAWLNDTFLMKAFTAEEQQVILTTQIDNGKEQAYKGYDISGGKNTEDRIFLLSHAEVHKYFGSDESRKALATDYAEAQGTWRDSDKICWWWLRSPGPSLSEAELVLSTGETFSNAVIYKYVSVRPAMWVDLGSGLASNE